MSSLKSWNERESDACDLCRTIDLNKHLWRIYIGRDWYPFVLRLCGGCNRALTNSKDADDIVFGIGLEILDRLKRRLPEPQFTKAWNRRALRHSKRVKQ